MVGRIAKRPVINQAGRLVVDEAHAVGDEFDEVAV
jgi:replicative superfamily II helicase